MPEIGGGFLEGCAHPTMKPPIPTLSAATVRKMHSILRKALKQAVLDGLIPRNVCDAVKPPKVERKEITPLDRQQTRSCSKRRAAIVSKPCTCWLYTLA
jgi:hypothetical protein